MSVAEEGSERGLMLLFVLLMMMVDEEEVDLLKFTRDWRAGYMRRT